MVCAKSKRLLSKAYQEDVIPRVASENSAAMVILGTTGRTGLSAVFIGNTAEHVIDKINCDVLALKPSGLCEPSRSNLAKAKGQRLKIKGLNVQNRQSEYVFQSTYLTHKKTPQALLEAFLNLSRCGDSLRTEQEQRFVWHQCTKTHRCLTTRFQLLRIRMPLRSSVRSNGKLMKSNNSRSANWLGLTFWVTYGRRPSQHGLGSVCPNQLASLWCFDVVGFLESHTGYTEWSEALCAPRIWLGQFRDSKSRGRISDIYDHRQNEA